MKLILDKYRKLKPRIEYLTDEAIIAQAWKKTHGYMRTHNWYADPLALDVSALALETNAQLWAGSLKKENIELTPLELVPAAKSEQWQIHAEKGWIPCIEGKKREDKPPVRPLAHLRIRDQTWATAVMMCLADAVETSQGDCSKSDISELHRKRVFSYGNRLLCDWSEQGAWFRWGNGETYRKFFTDYQNFLKRPVDVGRYVANSSSDLEHVFVINLDLSRFYDHIDRELLITRLKTISAKYDEKDLCPTFWLIVKQVIAWEWSSEAVEVAERIRIPLGKGLPQGLVASGFFANAYMIEFDKAIGRKIGNTIPEMPGVVLHDYCRYVDDLRLVVSVEHFDTDNLISGINKWISAQLTSKAGEAIELNGDKTKVTSLSDLDNRGSLSGRITLLQNELSGPADRDVLENATAILEGLLTTAPEVLPDDSGQNPDKDLIRLVKFDHDIRLDSLKRFAANRLESIMRNKRKLTVIDDSRGQGEYFADNESELLAKKLVKAWLQDPSLGLVLRKAIEIYPSPTIFEPVLEAIYKRSSVGGGGASTQTAAMMDYLLADIFRCCVDFNGFFQRVDYPKSAAPEEVLDMAASYAQRAISAAKVPKFMERQALLLLATLQKPVFIQAADSEKTIQHSLHAILVGSPHPSSGSVLHYLRWPLRLLGSLIFLPCICYKT